MDIVTTNHLSKDKRVQDLNLRVPEGAVYGFLGPNGAGKTTTLKLLLGLIAPSEGEIRLFGQSFNRQTKLDILRQVGSLIESPSYYGHLTGWENLKIIQTIRRVPERAIDEALEVVRLSKERHKRVNHYSLGMKQRLGIAMALLARPRLLILDEPTNGLDPAGIQEMRELIQDLPRRWGMTVMVSSHLLSEIDQMATVVGIIKEGRLVFQDDLAKLHERAKAQLALKTADNLRAAEILRKQNVPCTAVDDYLLLPLLSDSEVARMSCLLAAQLTPPLRLEERRQPLEEIFLQITGGKAVSL